MAKTGVVGTLKVGESNRAIGLRTDSDALDIMEENTFHHRSTHAGKMRACGHDGHTAMLLGAAAHGLDFEFQYDRRYPVLINTEAAAAAAAKVVGTENVIRDGQPTMGSEDFAWMLQDRPGCYIRIGNGQGVDGGCVVHNPNYDFNDTASVYGASYWATLVEQELSAD